MQMSAQDVWFPWLDHIQRIQSLWTETQEKAFGIWNNVSQFQDFAQYERQISEVLSLVAIMEKQRLVDKRQFGDSYPTFFELSGEYVQAMKLTITQLELILRKLKQKSQNLDSYALASYQKDLEHYDYLLTNYRNVGREMNMAFQKIQLSN